MTRKHYAKDNEDFKRVLEQPASRAFRPRFHFLYSEREAEQDAYFWFLQGQRVEMENGLRRIGIDPRTTTEREG